MDQLAPTLPSPRRRRSYSQAFKAMVVKACDEPGHSVAGVAQQYSLNANLIHKWRRQHSDKPTSEFLRLPVTKPVTRPGTDTVRIELPGDVTVHWPIEHINDAIGWVKAMMS